MTKEELARVGGYRIDQTVEVGEIVFSFETRNRYEVRTDAYDSLCSAVEERGSIWVRVLLGGWRPFELTVHSSTWDPVFTVTSPFRVFFNEATITGAEGEPVGTVRRRFGVLTRRYEVRDASDGSVYELEGSLFRPWTFHVLRDGERCGRIVKRWGGLFREGFGDADRFEADFPGDWPARHKTLLLGALLLLDFAHFESRLGHLRDVFDQLRVVGSG